MRALLLLGVIGALLAFAFISTPIGAQAASDAIGRSDAPSANVAARERVERPVTAEATIAGATQRVVLVGGASLILALAAVGARALWLENIVRSPLYGGME